MTDHLGRAVAAFVLGIAPLAMAQGLILPPAVVAGSAFSVPTNGSGKASLYIVGPGQALRRDVQAGQPAVVDAGQLVAAGHYVVIVTDERGTSTGQIDVIPAIKPATLGFLAKPSRLPVGLHNGISGAVYVFDAYHNLILTPMSASLELSLANGGGQVRTVNTRNGLAWATMDSASKEGSARFVARVGDVTSTRVIQEVPGDPCGISISARPNGTKVEVQTAPVRDCSGNAVPDGTVVTFLETYNNSQSAVDVPLKQGIAKVDLPSHPGAKISVASGVVAGNEISWAGSK